MWSRRLIGIILTSKRMFWVSKDLAMLSNSKIQHVVAGILLFVLLVVNVVLTRNVFTRPFPGHNDFMTPWEATRAFWLDGLSPYGVEASERIQMQIFGRPPLPEEDPGFFSYPLYATYFIVPLAGIPYSWASAIWMVFLEVCLVITLFLALSLLEWYVPPILMRGRFAVVRGIDCRGQSWFEAL